MSKTPEQKLESFLDRVVDGTQQYKQKMGF